VIVEVASAPAFEVMAVAAIEKSPGSGKQTDTGSQLPPKSEKKSENTTAKLANVLI